MKTPRIVRCGEVLPGEGVMDRYNARAQEDERALALQATVARLKRILKKALFGVLVVGGGIAFANRAQSCDDGGFSALPKGDFEEHDNCSLAKGQSTGDFCKRPPLQVSQPIEEDKPDAGKPDEGDRDDDDDEMPAHEKIPPVQFKHDPVNENFFGNRRQG